MGEGLRDEGIRGLRKFPDPKRSRVGPLRPTPAHSQMSLRDGIDVRLRGGIQIPAAVQAFGPPEKRLLFQVRTGRSAVW